jgi:transposase
MMCGEQGGYSMPIPVETRRKMVAAVDRGESVASVARRFEITERGLHKLIKRCRERGTLESAKPGPKKPIKLRPADDEKLQALIREDPGITLAEMVPHLSVKVDQSTVSRRLKKLGISLKKSR